LILVGEVYDLADYRFGKQLAIKHLPDFPFVVDGALDKRITKHFQREFDLAKLFADSHLMTAATFSVNQDLLATLEEVTFMNVTAQWLPFESSSDKELLDRLVNANRRFVRGLRYNLPSTRPMAAAVLSDTRPLATARYIVPEGEAATEPYMASLHELIQDSKLAAWQWNTSDGAIPSLPPIDATPESASRPKSSDSPPPEFSECSSSPAESAKLSSSIPPSASASSAARATRSDSESQLHLI
jgi:hypothetical protein